VSVAVKALGEDRAGNTTETGRDDDGARMSALASAAGLAAVGPAVPARELTIDSAGLYVAILGLIDDRASNTTVTSRLRDLTEAGLGAAAAHGSAQTPCTEVGHTAVDRAIVSVAISGDGSFGASQAAILGSSDDRSSGVLDTAAAGLVTGGPVTEVGEDAINLARLGVAGSFAGERRASSATEVSGYDDATPFSGDTTVADLGAHAILPPLTNGAVDGATPEVALSTARKSRAGETTVGSSPDDGAGVKLLATTARLVAVTPPTPRRHEAVDRAIVGVAVCGIVEVGARLAALCHGDDDGTLAVVGTTAADKGAHTVGGPPTDDAVASTDVHVALVGGGELGASNAAVQRLLGDGAGTSVGATAAV
jgi:hypothetical protein